MKKSFLLSAVLLAACTLQAQDFATYFEPARLRVNLILAGTADRQQAYLESLHAEPHWGGPVNHLVDTFNYGEYYYKVYSTGGEVIYSRGFNTLFAEWRATAEARRVARAMPVSLTLPMPKAAVRLEVLERIKQTGEWQLLLTVAIDPADPQIQRDIPNDYPVVQLHYRGDPAHKVDVVFIAEGYTAAEMDKFRADARRFADYLLHAEPYHERRDDFNIWTVESPSVDSGPDIPQQNSWRRTVAGATFYTFAIDRYLTAPNHTRLCELAWNVPYDQLYVLVNTDKYGGGGIYNNYGLSMSDNEVACSVFLHEFGHQFAGLADEYYTPDVAYEDFYNLQLEPWEPNLTTLVRFDKKWKDLLDPATPLPTPVEAQYAGTVGVFEGGGYVTKGMYRPMVDCRMKSNDIVFCPVCRRAILRMIDSYVE